MKKILVLALVIAAAAIGLTSCGTAGVPGDTYYGIAFDYTFHYYLADWDTDLPAGWQEGEYYIHAPGSWSYKYYLDDGIGFSADYWVDYTLEQDTGSVGLFPGMEGDDGVDLYWYTYAGWFGPTTYDVGANPSAKMVASADNPYAGQSEYTQVLTRNGWKLTMHVKRLDTVGPDGSPEAQVKK